MAKGSEILTCLEETGMNVLVVDDSMLNLQFAKKYLSELQGINDIILCEQPTRVHSILDEGQVDIILLDLIMPELTGFDILKIVRSEEKYQYIPIIMLTAQTDKESFLKCFELGANDYITKPINPDEFFARIKVAIRTRRNYLYQRGLVSLTQRQNEELKEINIKLVDAKNSLIQSEKMVAIGNLAAGIAHEINNPLGFVSGNSEILKKYFSKIFEYLDFVNEKIFELTQADIESVKLAEQQMNELSRKLKIGYIREDIDALFSESFSGLKRIADIVLSLRTFAHTDVGLDKGQDNLSVIINQVIVLCKNEAKHVADIDTEVDEELMIYGNKVQLAQVFMNIIINAIQAIKSQGRNSMGKIKIIAYQENDFICVDIMDDGPGIPEEHQSKIFDPFFTTKDVGKGTGLGLSISYDIVVMKHNGKISFESQPGVGTKFSIKIPNHTQDETGSIS